MFVAGLVYVVDSSDRARLPEARSELLHILSHNELNDVPLVVIANKTDVKGGDNSGRLNLHFKLSPML